MKSNYLKKMGITQWRLREMSLDATHPVCLYSAAAQCLLIARLVQSDEHVLLQKIAAAIANDFTIVEALPAAIQFVIDFGDIIKAALPEESIKAPIIKTAALQDLMHDPALKKQLWVNIKKVNI